MMKRSLSHNQKGFTLMEVMVSLIVATLIVGGVMGSISVAMQYTKRVKDKSEHWPILEAAAQEVLAHPEKAEKGTLTMEDLPDTPAVAIHLTEVTRADGMSVGNRFGKLYRAKLEYEKHVLELSLLVPESGFPD